MSTSCTGIGVSRKSNGNVGKVFQNQDVLGLMFSFQSGISFLLRGRLLERFQTIIIPGHEFQYLPRSFRPLNFSKTRKISMVDLHLSVEYRDSKFPFHVAIAEGELDIVKALLDFNPQYLNITAFFCGAVHNRLEIFTWLLTYMATNMPKELNIMIYSLLQHARANRTRGSKFILEYWKHLDQKIPLDIRYPLDMRYVEAIYFKYHARALEEGNLEIFIPMLLTGKLFQHPLCQDLFANHNDFIITAFDRVCNDRQVLNQIFSFATKNGHIHVLRWLIDQLGNKMLLKYWDTILNEANLNVVCWLVENYSSTLEEDHVYRCGLVDDIRVVQCLHQGGHSISKIIPGSIEVAQYFLTHGVVFQVNQCIDVLFNSLESNITMTDVPIFIEQLKFYCSRAHGVVFEPYHMDKAIYSGSLEIVQFLLDQPNTGCSRDSVKFAIQNEFTEILMLVHQKLKCLLPSEKLKIAIDAAFKNEDWIDSGVPPLLKYFFEVGDGIYLTWSSEEELIYKCSVEMIEWILENCKPNESPVRFANFVHFGDIDLLERIAQKYQPSLRQIEQSMDEAKKLRSTNILPYLLELQRQSCNQGTSMSKELSSTKQLTSTNHIKSIRISVGAEGADITINHSC